MAFGSWFKEIVKGAKNVFNKVLPALKKGAEIVSSVAPVISSAIGGTAGNIISNVGKFAGKVTGNVSGNNKPLLGSGGAGRFEIPLLK